MDENRGAAEMQEKQFMDKLSQVIANAVDESNRRTQRKEAGEKAVFVSQFDSLLDEFKTIATEVKKARYEEAERGNTEFAKEFHPVLRSLRDAMEDISQSSAEEWKEILKHQTPIINQLIEEKVTDTQERIKLQRMMERMVVVVNQQAEMAGYSRIKNFLTNRIGDIGGLVTSTFDVPPIVAFAAKKAGDAITEYIKKKRDVAARIQAFEKDASGTEAELQTIADESQKTLEQVTPESQERIPVAPSDQPTEEKRKKNRKEKQEDNFAAVAFKQNDDQIRMFEQMDDHFAKMSNGLDIGHQASDPLFVRDVAVLAKLNEILDFVATKLTGQNIVASPEERAAAAKKEAETPGSGISLASLKSKKKRTDLARDSKGRFVKRAPEKPKNWYWRGIDKGTAGVKKVGGSLGRGFSSIKSGAGSLAKGAGNVVGKLGAGVGQFAEMGGGLLKGAAALAIMAGSIWVFSKALQNFAEVKWEDVAKGFVVVGGMAAVVGILSAFAPAALPAALAMGVMSGAMLGFSLAAMIGATALEKLTPVLERMTEIDGLKLLPVAMGIGALGLALIPFGVGGVLSALGGIGFTATVENLQKLGELDGDKMMQAATGIAAIGDALVTFAKGQATSTLSNIFSNIFGGESVIDKVIALGNAFGEMGKVNFENVDRLAKTDMSTFFTSLKQLDGVSLESLQKLQAVGGGMAAVSSLSLEPQMNRRADVLQGLGAERQATERSMNVTKSTTSVVAQQSVNNRTIVATPLSVDNPDRVSRRIRTAFDA